MNPTDAHQHHRRTLRGIGLMMAAVFMSDVNDQAGTH